MKKTILILLILLIAPVAFAGNIDLMGNHVPDNATIEAESLQQLNRVMPPREREKLSGADLAALHATIDAGESAMKSDRDLLKVAIALEKAERKLAEKDKSKPEFPDVDDGDGGLIENPAVTKQKNEKAAAQATKDGATTAALQLQADRNAAKEALQ